MEKFKILLVDDVPDNIYSLRNKIALYKVLDKRT